MYRLEEVVSRLSLDGSSKTIYGQNELMALGGFDGIRGDNVFLEGEMHVQNRNFSFSAIGFLECSKA